MRKENGITLIALVITIIVLLILAGVAISMLSGENGILKKAAEAKTKTEEGKEYEETALATAELETYFITNNLKYKCSNGFITGFTVNDKKVEETVEYFEGILEPLGYKLNLKYDRGQDKDIKIENKSEAVATGMSVQKDGQTVAKTVVFGDLHCDGKISAADRTLFKRYFNGSINPQREAIKVAMDLNNDGKNDVNDYLIIGKVSANEYVIDQNKYAENPDTITEDKESYQMDIYINELYTNIKDSTIYSLETKINSKGIIYNELQVNTTDSAKVEELLTMLPANSSIKRNGQEVATTENIQNGDEIIYTYNEREFYIGKIVIK